MKTATKKQANFITSLTARCGEAGRDAVERYAREQRAAKGLRTDSVDVATRGANIYVLDLSTDKASALIDELLAL